MYIYNKENIEYINKCKLLKHTMIKMHKNSKRKVIWHIIKKTHENNLNNIKYTISQYTIYYNTSTFLLFQCISAKQNVYTLSIFKCLTGLQSFHTTERKKSSAG